MKKIKLLAPLLTVSALGSSAAMLTSCNQTTKFQIALFTNEGGTLEGGNKNFEVVAGTKWKDIPNKPTPTKKDGYEFIGWYRGDAKITDETVINSSMDVYAWFTLVSPATKYVTVIASPGGKIAGGASSTIVQITSSGTRWGDVMPKVTADEKYTFNGWWLNDAKIDEDTIISENCYIYAWFDAEDTNKFKVKFECLEGGLFDQSATTVVEFDKTKVKTWGAIKASAPTPIPTAGYKFEGWYLNKGQTALKDDTSITETSYIFAYFEQSEVNVSIGKVDHATITQPTEDLKASNFNVMRETLDQLVVPDEGYELTGWTIDGNRVMDNQIIDSETPITITPIISEGAFNSYRYNEDKLTATVDKKLKAQADLMIPSYVFKDGKAYKVTGIQYYDGDGFYYHDSTIKTLCLPNTLVNIADRAFNDTYNLNTVYIPKSAQRFAYQCFYKTPNLTSFNFLGTIEEYKKITKEGWWNDGMRTKVCICTDGTTNV